MLACYFTVKSHLKMLPSLIFYTMLCLGIKLVKRRSQSLYALVGGKQ